jgi:phage tail-like protein
VSDDRTWWPDISGFDLPAFRVQREAYSDVEGGDYVRGSTVPDLPHTALRYPTDSLDLTAVSKADRGLLFAKACDRGPADLYTTVEVEWNWPKAVLDTFEEAAVVRSAYGAPSSPDQGVTIYRKLRKDLMVDDAGGLIPPQILYDYFPPTKIKDVFGVEVNGITPNGRWYYYTAFFRTNSIDWTPLMSDQCLLPSNYRHSDHLWNAIPPYYQWVDDNLRAENGYLRQFLTVFGFELDRTREYVESLLELHHVDQSPMLLLKHLGDNYGYPWEEGIGDIRYRALMANISRLLQVRGTAKGLLGLVETVSKYDCDLTYGVNTVLLPDDSNFMYSTGHWAPMHPDTTLQGVAKANYLTWDLVKVEHKPIPTPAPANTGATGAMLVDTADANTLDIFVALGCGKIDMTSPVADKEFVPYYSGLPINPGEMYGFSAYVKAAKSITASAYMLTFRPDGTPANNITATVPGFLTPGTGSATTPNFAGTAINADMVWVAKIRKNNINGVGKIASKYLASAVYAWEWYIDSVTFEMKMSLANAAGSAQTPYTLLDATTWLDLPINTDLWLAYWIDVSTGGSWYQGVSISYDGYTYTPIGTTITTAGAYTSVGNTALINVGNTSGGTTRSFDGIIYWAEQRTGTNPKAGNIVWRFDANDYAGSTPFTDPRGKVWTLAAPTAITAKVVTLDPPPSSPNVINDAGAGWTEVKVAGVMPAGAGYMVPALYFDARTTGGIAGRSPAIHVAAAMVYLIQSQEGGGGVITTVAPDRYLVLGNPTQLMGPTRSSPPYTGFEIGAPE